MRKTFICENNTEAHRSNRHVAALGSALVLLSITIGPFTQQAIQYQYCQGILSRADSSTSMPRAKRLSPPNSGTAALPLSFRGSVLEGLMFPNDKNIDVTFTCEGGNCTYPVHSSLAMCFLCSNAIYNVSHSCPPNSSQGCTSMIAASGPHNSRPPSINFEPFSLVLGSQPTGHGPELPSGGTIGSLAAAGSTYVRVALPNTNLGIGPTSDVGEEYATGNTPVVATFGIIYFS